MQTARGVFIFACFVAATVYAFGLGTLALLGLI